MLRSVGREGDEVVLVEVAIACEVACIVSPSYTHGPYSHQLAPHRVYNHALPYLHVKGRTRKYIS